MTEPIPHYATIPAHAAPTKPLLEDVLSVLTTYRDHPRLMATAGPAEALRLTGVITRVMRALGEQCHKPDPEAECVIAELRIPATAADPALTFYTTVQVIPKTEIRFVARDLSGEVWWSDRADDPILLSDIRTFPREGEAD